MSHPKIKTRINIHMDNFDEHAKEVIKELYQNNVNADVVIKSKNRKFPCHRLVLTFCSEFFKRILEETPYTHPWATPVIIIPEFEDDIIEYIVQFIYTGEIRVNEERFNEFLEACNLLQLKSMINYDYASRLESEESETIQTTTYQETHLEPEEAMQVQIIGDYSDSEYQIVSNKDATDMSGFEIEVIDQGNVIESTTPTPFESKKRKRQTGKRESSAATTKSAIKRERIVKDDPEYIENMKKGISDVIHNKVSFQTASTKYNLSKTHLWRVCQSTPEYHLQREPSLNPELNAAIIDALKTGETLLSISKRFNVPVSTLHRRKSMLYEQGELPEHVRIKQRNRGEDFGQRLDMAINDITTLGTSQTEAAKKYRIPKTTIWRRLKKLSGVDPHYKTFFKPEDIKIEDDQVAYELISTYNQSTSDYNQSSDDYQQADDYQPGTSADEIIMSETIDTEEQEIVAVDDIEESHDAEMSSYSENVPTMEYLKEHKPEPHSETSVG